MHSGRHVSQRSIQGSHGWRIRGQVTEGQMNLENKNKLRKAGYLILIGLGIIMVTAFLTGQIIMPLIFARPKNIEVPDLIGKNISTAKRILQEAGLHVVVRDSVWSDSAKIESVLEQHPEPGTMAKLEGTVYLVICKGSQIVAVPGVVGRSYEEAFLTLRNSGLRASVADSLFSQSYPANTVIRTSPPNGSRVEKNAMVRLFLSRGPEAVADTLGASVIPSGTY
jgi:serine/threonine-protein kinase